MRAPYRRSYEPVGATYHADLYCLDCATLLPETDPEGNPKCSVLLDHLDSFEGYCCAKCSTPTKDW